MLLVKIELRYLEPIQLLTTFQPCVQGMAVLSRVDTAKSAIECREFLQTEAKVMYNDEKLSLDK